MAIYKCPSCGDLDFSYNNGKCMRCGHARKVAENE